MQKTPGKKNNIGFLIIIVFHLMILYTPAVNEYYLIDSPQNMLKKSDVFNLTEADRIWVEKILSSMTTYEKCAQVFMPAVFGKNLDQSSNEFKSTVELVKIHGVGGIVISSGNVEETADMINELQKFSKIPMLISADFENGIGMRMKAANSFPHSMAVGATGNSEFAYETGKATAIEALMLGVNINFAPVADVNNNPENPVINLRSYSEDKNLVAEFCRAYLKGSSEGGVIATAKHFPGHGNTHVDSHNDLPVIKGNIDYLIDNELNPFIKLIDEGVLSIMIGHLNVPAFDDITNLPASLSYRIVTKLLKERLGFKGLIITDALDMKAVTNYYSNEEACVQAFKAGNDILLMPSKIREGISAIYEAVKRGDITIERLDESVRKILSAKRWLKLDQFDFHKRYLPKRIRIQEHYQLSKEIAENSATIVKFNDQFFPFDTVNYHKTAIINITNRISISESHFTSVYKEEFGLFKTTTLTNASSENEYKSALNLSRDCEIIILSGYFSIKSDENGKSLSGKQEKFINDIISLNKKVVLISFENPYIISYFPKIENYICTYSNSKSSQRAVVNILKGVIEPRGSLPVSIPFTDYKLGYKWDRTL